MVKKIFDSKLIRIASTILEWIIGAVLVVLVCLTLFQSFSKQGDFFGYRVYIVGSESMVPTYYVGDTLLIKETNIEDIEVGDSVTYVGKHEGIEDLIITHQLKKKEKDVDGKYLLHIKGIANDVEDPLVYEDQLLGKVVYKFVILSFLGKIVTNTYLTIVCITIPIVVLILVEIIKVLFKKDTAKLAVSSEKEEGEDKEVVKHVSERTDLKTFGEVIYSHFANDNNRDNDNINVFNTKKSLEESNSITNSMKSGYTSNDYYDNNKTFVNNFSAGEEKIEEKMVGQNNLSDVVPQKVSTVSFDFNKVDINNKIDAKVENEVSASQERMAAIQKKFDLKEDVMELPKVKMVQPVKTNEETFVLDLPKTKVEVREMEEKKNNSIKVESIPVKDVAAAKKTAVKIKEIDDFFNN